MVPPGGRLHPVDWIVIVTRALAQRWLNVGPTSVTLTRHWISFFLDLCVGLVSQKARDVWLNVDLMLGQRLRRWSSNKSTLGQRLVFDWRSGADTSLSPLSVHGRCYLSHTLTDHMDHATCWPVMTTLVSWSGQMSVVRFSDQSRTCVVGDGYVTMKPSLRRLDFPFSIWK